MKKCLFLPLLALLLSGCANHGPKNPPSWSLASTCPQGTVMICDTDRLHSCGCGQLISHH